MLTEVERLIDVIAGELFHQSIQFTSTNGAPYVWDCDNGDYVAIDGRINLRQIAVAVIAQRRI